MKTSILTKTQITVNASPSEVFTYIDHVKYHHLWNPQVKTWSSTPTLKLGSRYNTTSLLLGIETQITNQVTKIAPGKNITIENKVGVLTFIADFKLKPNSQGTEVRCDLKASVDRRVFAFSLPLLEKRALEELHTNLRALKYAVEHKLT